MVGDARSIEQLDATRILLSKRRSGPIDQQPFSSWLFHSQTPKLAKPSATQNVPLFTLNQRIISSLSCACHNCSPSAWPYVAPYCVPCGFKVVSGALGCVPPPPCLPGPSVLLRILVVWFSGGTRSG